MPPTDRSRVVVGVDGSDDMSAVNLAAQEAALRHRPLPVVHGFIRPYMKVPLDPPPFGPQECGLRNEAKHIIGQAVKQARQAQPDIEVTGEVVTGTGAQESPANAAGDRLVVIKLEQ